MLDPKYIREHADEVKENVRLRNASVDVDEFLRLDAKRLELQRAVESLRAERNAVAENMKTAVDDAREAFIAKGKALKDAITEKETELKEIEAAWNELALRIPNLTHPDVPRGASDEENVEIRKGGEIRSISSPRSHTELLQMHDLADFERGAKVAGAKFYFLKGKLALLEQAVLRYGIDFAMREGFEFLTTPDMAREEVLVGKGFMPRGPEKQVYFIEGEDLALLGTAEPALLGYHMKETLPAKDLPKKYVGFSHCFRTEAGAYGRESYGLYRVHQFAKVELFAYALPDQSEGLQEDLVRIEEAFWKSLGVPYRVVDCCTGDLGGSDYRRYDIEAWMWGKGEGKGGWGEVTSASNCIDFQSRRMNISYKDTDSRGLVHTLNGTMVATPRALIAILENHQQADGTIKIPEVLVPYCGFDTIGQ